ncbi:hypothetical protein NX722_10925 [Endozoicomonas gorgoniicola]|uniref:C2H2-type domain-containing protein n=1 Tax=Endozoicomonas gorgoniicola TaxID=1234144 RepID=A0ABT3MVW2_9GAMM|nr:hypothetical protein [Endozoicomonas gorgoniicola]MCW7553139.1 hypothetical protein [Endozoicomonas gorgoniicola]
MTDERKLAIPAPEGDIQVNFCKNPKCNNFGIAPEGPDGNRRYRYLQKTPLTHALFCKACDRISILKANTSINSELQRFQFPVDSQPPLVCPEKSCENHARVVHQHQGSYRKFGKTASGSPRYQCKSCGKIFSQKKQTRRHRRPELNERIFMSLVNRIPFNRICEIENVQPKTIYDKLTYIYNHCRRFSAKHELKLARQPKKDFFLATDTRNLHLNWQHASSRKNTCIQTVTTVDTDSGYVLACHDNINMEYSLEAIEQQLNDYPGSQPLAFRPHAHFLVRSDYRATDVKSPAIQSNNLLEDIEQKYREMSIRQDFAVAGVLNNNTSPPSEGVQVRFDYTLYGHFARLKQLLPDAGKHIFYLAYDSGLREACISLYADRIRSGQAEAFYIRIGNELSIASKRQKIREANNHFRAVQECHPHLDKRAIEQLIILERMKEMPVIGHWGDSWLFHPSPHMGEPDKAVCHITHQSQLPEKELANYYLHASLFGASQFYERLKNRISMVPIQNNAEPPGMWKLYGAYKPSVVIKLIEILRTYHNFVLTDKYGETPAKRLGISQQGYSISEILNCQPGKTMTSGLKETIVA